jgi:hypothetical protein
MTSTRQSENGHGELEFLKQFGGLNVGYAAELLETYGGARPELLQPPVKSGAGTDELAAQAGRPGAIPLELLREVRSVQSYVASIRNYGSRDEQPK